MTKKLRVVILKASKYGFDGYVERFRRGFMPNSTIPYMRSLTPDVVLDVPTEVHTIDEYVHTNLDYMDLLRKESGVQTLVALVGIQSQQFHRALDLAAKAISQGSLAVMGGPHVITCDTSMFHGKKVSFALAEAELLWNSILEDALKGELQDVYGTEQRWQRELQSPVIVPPSRRDLQRYIVPMLGLYPARGCPFVCQYCSVIKIAGRRVRSQKVETTIASLKAAKAAGVRTVMFTSDNFNKYDDAPELMRRMIEEKLDLPFFVQCDTQIARQEELVEFMGRAGCFQIFVGAESFKRSTLLAAHKGQNRPELYHQIVALCEKYGISSHFSNIIGFPDDDPEQIKIHIDTLCELNPTWASFYVLCPIPGTEQYDDFIKQGLITEQNLDRFDTTCMVWRHPTMSTRQLNGALFECYSRFYTLRHALGNVRQLRFRGSRTAEAAASLGNSLWSRYSAWRDSHPLAGGMGRVRIDGISDYKDLRKAVFGIELAPLPSSLVLPPADQLANRLLNPMKAHDESVA